MSESLEADAKAREAVIKWLDVERERVLGIARELGVPASVSVNEVVTTIDEKSGNFNSRRVPASVSPIAIDDYAWAIARHAEGKPEPATPAALLHETYRDRCRKWAPLVVIDFAKDPLKWIDTNLLGRVRSDYLSRLESLERSDRALAESLANDLLRLIKSATVDFVTWLPIAGLRLKVDSLRHDRVLIRALSPHELGAQQGSVFDRMQRPRRHRQPFNFDFRVERLALEVRTPCKNDPQTQPMSDFFCHKLLLALQLMHFEPHGRGEAATWTEPSPSSWTGGHHFRLPERGSTKDITLEDLKTAVELATRVPLEVFGALKSKQHVALHRFHLGAAEEQPADALIDYAVALEALLLPDDFEGELTFKLRLYGAHFLGSTGEERRRLYGEINEIYKARSALVHGKKPWAPEKIKAAAETARRVAADALRRAVTVGFPSQEQLQAAALNAPIADTNPPRSS